MISATAIAPFLLLGVVTASLMQYEFNIPPHISLVLVFPALAIGLVITYGISFATGIPVWYIVVALCVGVVGAAVVSEL